MEGGFFQFVVQVLLLSLCLSQKSYSGLYVINFPESSDDFAASWLISKSRFCASEERLNVATNMAGVSFAIVRDRCTNCGPFHTRDYLDFMVEHLSSVSNQIPYGNKQIFNMTAIRLKRTIRQLKKISQHEVTSDRRLNETVGILVFSSNSFSVYNTFEQSMIREYFFEATFWSVYRYIRDIVVFVGNMKDYGIVRNMNLPAISLIILNTPLDVKNRTTFLPKFSVLYSLYRLRDDANLNRNQSILQHLEEHRDYDTTPWNKYQYVYFTEGDQILHMRSAKYLYDAMDDSGGAFAMVPHRMLTVLVQKTFPQEYHKHWGVGKANVQTLIPAERVVTENLAKARGSCCDNGKNVYAPCKGWWYNCIDYGLVNFTHFLRFGKTGYEMPTSSEHQYTCEYTPEYRQCPLPSNCQYRMPGKYNHTACLASQEIRKFGFVDKKKS